ncbi:MAG: iron-sulfur cluster assembly accessory protein [Nostocaceae cyanobacterium]|nr:iron-sulfur cluster assembly accessory protein [Nostocaceae cyanobacterium]
MIQLSLAAATEIRRLMSKQQQSKLIFRLAVKPGGCSGWFYHMSFDVAATDGNTPQESLGDHIIESNGIQVAIDSQTYEYVKGLKLDYSEDLMGGGFRFHNPQVSATCGCGNSFSLAG